MENEKTESRTIKLKEELERIEGQLTGGEIPAEGLEDFRRAVDSLRMTVWAVLTASESDQYDITITRFRLNRAVESCQQIVGDINSGSIAADSPELRRFHDTIRDTLKRVESLTRPGS